MLLAGLCYPPFFFGRRPGGGGGVLAFLHCVLCAWPGLGWDPYPLFTLSRFSDTPPLFLPTEHHPPSILRWLQPSHCQQTPCALHKTPHPPSSSYHRPQQFRMFNLYSCAVWAPWQQLPVPLTHIWRVVWETWGKKVVEVLTLVKYQMRFTAQKTVLRYWHNGWFQSAREKSVIVMKGKICWKRVMFVAHMSLPL